MKQTLEDRIRNMVGKKYLYNANEQKVLSYRFENNNLIIVTNRTWVEVPITAANKKLDEFLPIESEENSMALISLQRENRESLINLIQDNIAKIKNNPEYIKQAKEINSQVRTILDIVKTELQIHKASEKF